MEYTKPEVVVLDNAISVVQMSKLQGVKDNADPTQPVPVDRRVPVRRVGESRGAVWARAPRLLYLGN